MGEESYKFECMRAELLGVDAPDYEEYAERQRNVDEVCRIAGEVGLDADDEADNLKQVDAHVQMLCGASGKMDELNHILSATQKRLNKFKVRCGSVGDLIKTKIGSMTTTTTVTTTDEQTEQLDTAEGGEMQRPQGSQLGDALENNVDKLDLLLSKAERAEMSLNAQNKQIKRFLK